jgi:hypothetical protein
MLRILKLEQGIIGGVTVRDILEVFPEIENRFRQRKTYDEFYFDGSTVELTIEKISSLNDLGFKVSINWEEVILSY